MSDTEWEALRSRVQWHREYRPEWDASPNLYVDAGIVNWGKSRRLGLLKWGRVKAYLGVQHVDPSLAGWRIVEAPEARFFASLFLEGRIVTLRSFPTIESALRWLDGIVAAE